MKSLGWGAVFLGWQQSDWQGCLMKLESTKNWKSHPFPGKEKPTNVGIGAHGSVKFGDRFKD
jgi:hypothetical protein